MYYRINLTADKKTLILQSASGAAPAVLAGMTDIGTFKHEATGDTLAGGSAVDINHVLYQHIQHRLYSKGYLDPSKFGIYLDPPTSLTVVLTPTSIQVGKIGVATVTSVPANADKTVKWSSSDVTVATVNSKGKVIGIKVGTAVIRADSTTYGAKTSQATQTVTVAT